jgi:hypothetical protein
VNVLSRIRFDDHPLFQTTTLRLTLGGAAGGLVALGARWAFGWEHAYEMTMGSIALGVATGILWGRRPLARFLLAPLLGLAATGLLLATGGAHEPAGLALMGALLGWPLSSGLPRWRRASVVVCAGLGSLLGVAVARALEQTALTAVGAPDLAAFALEGGVVGFFVSLGTLGRHLHSRRDILTETLTTATRELPPEFSELVGRVRETRSRVLEAIERRTDGDKERIAVKKAVDELSTCMINVGRKWQAVDRDLGGTTVPILAQRIADLQIRIDAATDDEARRAYERARGALEDQLQHHSEIARSRERTVARLHSYLAVLERLHLAVVRFRSSDAHRFAGEMQPLLDELDGVGTDAELAAQAMEESQKGATAAS